MTAFGAMYPTQASAPGVVYNGPSVQLIERTFDAANKPATINGVATTTGAGDTYRILPIQKGTMVIASGLEVLTVDAGGGTLSVGDSAGATTFQSALAVSALANFLAAATTWKLYTANDYFLVTINTAALTTAKFRVWAIVANVAQSDEGRALKIAT